MTAPLYQIAAEYRQALDALAELDLDPQTVADTVEGMSGELHDKLRAVIAYSLDLDVLATGTEEAAKRMADLAKSRRNRVQALRDYALQAMQATGIAEVATDEFAAKVAKKPAAVVIAEGAELPAEFVRTKWTTEPDKAALKIALTAGREIAGCALVQGFRLAVR
jgi:hypothetical protein